MFENVVVSGCSLTAGEELLDLDARWSRTLALRLNKAKLWSYARVGVSNEVISQNLINGLISQQHVCTPDNTLVVVQWTYSTRLNFMGKKDRFYTLAHHNMTPEMRKRKVEMGHLNVYFNDDFDDIFDLDFYYKYHNNPLYLLYNTAKLIHHTQSFLKTKGYKYLFVFCDNTEKKLLDLRANAFNLSKTFEKDYLPPFYHMVNDLDRSNIFPTTFFDFTERNKYPIGPGRHPLEKANYEYGKLLYEYVKEKFNV